MVSWTSMVHHPLSSPGPLSATPKTAAKLLALPLAMNNSDLTLKQPNEGIQPSTTLQEVEKPSNITHLEPLKLHRSKCQNDIIEPESR